VGLADQHCASVPVFPPYGLFHDGMHATHPGGTQLQQGLLNCGI
jgi:hypothetical protein